MALPEAESVSSLAPRPLIVKGNRSSSGLRTGVSMPSYTLQEDPPWLSRAAHAPTASSPQSDNVPDAETGRGHSPLTPSKQSYHASSHAHPKQTVLDHGPQLRQSRLPLFKNVRSMLHRPPQLAVPPTIVKWDDYSGEMSENGKPATVKPSTYVSPQQSAFAASHERSPENSELLKPKPKPSEVGELRSHEETEVKRPAPLKISGITVSAADPISPVSPVSAFSHASSGRRTTSSPISVDIRTEVSPANSNVLQTKQFKRKPISSNRVRSPSQTENVEPQRSPSQGSDWTEPPSEDMDHELNEGQLPDSHFSWTTYTPSVALGRASVDTAAAGYVQQPSLSGQPASRFSWSTANTSATHLMRPDSPPPSPPPPIPQKYASTAAPPTSGAGPSQGPPVQSILSRRRPIQRLEREDWTPTPRDRSVGAPCAETPSSAHAIYPVLRGESPSATTPSGGNVPTRKALPLPPNAAPVSPAVSHLEKLLADEAQIIRQRKHVEREIARLEAVQKASPMEVTFQQVRETKRKLEALTQRLAEEVMDERNIGIAISRARRKEGEEEGLWVRRVTG